MVDSHAHLEGERYNSDRDEVMARAKAAGVETILAIGNGSTPEELGCALRLSQTYECVYATTGVHPHEAAQANEECFDAMQRIAREDKVLAWGEIGLDYFYDHSPRDTQKQVFVRQMEMAAAARLPIIIHCRPSQAGEDAWEDCLTLLAEQWAPRGLGGILHCFTGEWKHAARALDIGFLISFAGNLTFPKAQNIRDVAAQVPADRYLIETDSPFLAPVPHRGKRNEPAFVAETARAIGELRGQSAQQVGEQTAQNFANFFSLHEKLRSI